MVIRHLRAGSLGTLARLIAQLGSTAVIARLLGPSEFGAGAFFSALGSIYFLTVNISFNTVIVLSECLDSEVWSRVGAANRRVWIVASAAFAIIGLLASPVGHSETIAYIAVFWAGSLAPLFGGRSTALLQRERRFGVLAANDVAGAGVGALIGVISALATGNAIALVLQYVVTEATIPGLATWRSLSAKARIPKGKGLEDTYPLRLAMQSTGASVLTAAWRNGDNALVGSFLGVQALGYYAIAYRVMTLPLTILATILSRVSLPLLRPAAKGNQMGVRLYISQLTAALLFASLPFTLLLIMNAGLVVRLAAGEGWGHATSALQILLVTVPFQILTAIAGPLLQAQRRPDVLLKANALSALGVAVCVPALAHSGLEAVCIGIDGIVVAASVGHIIPAWRSIGLRLTTLLRPAALGLLVSAACGAAFVLAYGHWNQGFKTLFASCVGGLLALGIVSLLRPGRRIMTLWFKVLRP